MASTTITVFTTPRYGLLSAAGGKPPVSPFNRAGFAPPVQIEVPEFLTTFFKISAAAKGMAAKGDSGAKLKEYRLALKVRQGLVCLLVCLCVRLFVCSFVRSFV